jgi:hypothetical protein
VNIFQVIDFIAVARASVSFCSRSFHPFRCDIVAALLKENGAGGGDALPKRFLAHGGNSGR